MPEADIAVEAQDNETRRVIAEAVEAGRRDVPLDVNPAFRALDTMLVEGVAGDVVLSFTAGEEMVQGNGVVGGGSLAAMLDSAMAVAVLSALKPGQNCATITLTVNMLRAAAPGTLYARAAVEKLGRSVAFVHAQLLDENRTLLATATSSLAIFKG